MPSKTVGQFAADLGMPEELLLAQLHSAGVDKMNVDEELSKDDKDRLLTHLRALHGTADGPRIQLATRQQRAIQALAAGENGAEWSLLEELAVAVLSADTIEHDFQLVANAIVAKIWLLESLPHKRKGRPKNETDDGFAIANRYFFFKDGGDSYEQAVAKVAQEYCKDERHIMRLVKANKHYIGHSIEERTKKREWWAMCAKSDREIKAAGGTTYLDRFREMLEEPQQRDLIAELDEMILQVTARATTDKI